MRNIDRSAAPAFPVRRLAIRLLPATAVLAAAICGPTPAAAAQSGYDDIRGLQTRLGQVQIRPAEQVGAKGDGQADDTAALQAWLDRPHAVLQLTPGKTYRLTHSLVLHSGSGIVGYGTKPGRLLMSASGFNCDYAAGCKAYATDPHAVGLYAAGRPGAPLNGIVLDHFAITGEGAAQSGKTLMAIVCNDIVGLRITRLDISRLTNAVGVRCSGLSGDSVIANNVIHDFYDPSPGPLPNLMAGILIDGDSNGRVPSTTKLSITGNRVTDIRYSPAFAAKYQQQSSGIVVITGATGVIATRNDVERAGQGFDWHGSKGTLTGNTVKQIDLFCLKFIHGASDNVVTGNTLIGCGLAGISLGGGDSQRPVVRNRITGNVIRGIDPTGANAGHATAAIWLLQSKAGGNSADNILGPNDIDVGNGNWVVNDEGPTDRGNIVKPTGKTKPGRRGLFNLAPGTATVQ